MTGEADPQLLTIPRVRTKDSLRRLHASVLLGYNTVWWFKKMEQDDY